MDAFIGCRSRNMIISNGTITKKLVLYPPAQPHDNLEKIIWPTLEEEEDHYSLQTLMNIEHNPLLVTQDEDELIDHII